MDWKAVVIDSLVTYNAKKNAIENILCEIQLIDCDIKKTDEAIENGLPTGSVDDLQLSRCIMQKKLEKNLVATRKAIGDVQNALSGLTEEEQHILDMLYIQKEKKTMASLCSELGYSKATMYRKRDSALRKYAAKLYDICL